MMVFLCGFWKSRVKSSGLYRRPFYCWDIRVWSAGGSVNVVSDLESGLCYIVPIWSCWRLECLGARRFGFSSGQQVWLYMDTESLEVNSLEGSLSLSLWFLNSSLLCCPDAQHLGPRDDPVSTSAAPAIPSMCHHTRLLHMGTKNQVEVLTLAGQAFDHLNYLPSTMSYSYYGNLHSLLLLNCSVYNPYFCWVGLMDIFRGISTDPYAFKLLHR